jgi:thioredoxin 1
MEEHAEEHAAVTLTDANYKAEVKDYDGLVLVDYWADWCTPCKIMAPAVEEIAKKYKAQGVKVGKIDVDNNQETSMAERIMSLPTFRLFYKGEVVDEVIGSVGGPALEQIIIRKLPQDTPAAA